MKRYTVELAFERLIFKNIMAKNEEDAIEEAFSKAFELKKMNFAIIGFCFACFCMGVALGICIGENITKNTEIIE
jgi:hypothetical protein